MFLILPASNTSDFSSSHGTPVPHAPMGRANMGRAPPPTRKDPVLAFPSPSPPTPHVVPREGRMAPPRRPGARPPRVELIPLLLLPGSDTSLRLHQSTSPSTSSSVPRVPLSAARMPQGSEEGCVAHCSGVTQIGPRGSLFPRLRPVLPMFWN
jgi:hypothetical protein